MSDKIRVGVIGCGAGRFHAHQYAFLANVELAALADPDQQRCRELAAKYDVPRLYRDHTELLAQPDIDGVSVCVPNHLHAPVAIAALEAGKHVLVEKPLATSVAEGEAIAKAAARTDRVLMVTFNYRFRSDSQILKRHVEAGNLDEIYFARAGWLRHQGIPTGANGWFTDKARSGGGCLIDLGVHMLDLALWLMGNPRVLSVNAATYAALGPRGRGLFPGRRFAGRIATFDVEDFVAALLRLEIGATLILEVSWAGYTQRGDRFFVHLWGKEGGAELNVLNYTDQDTLSFHTDLQGTRADISPQTWGKSEKSVQGEFVRAICQGHALSPTVEEGLQVLRIIEAIYRSAAEGCEIKL
jgi:predicted dehydrogenase